ncbi:glycoside hydrolase domain-containing protein [Microlunatus sp. GCM10028923]|uniref:glycoside hydrolase domain-containing protein n=1 Tax=Microlunatus sp. GCM10028923 TaxID=3273400 RepID=UPI00361828F1
MLAAVPMTAAATPTLQAWVEDSSRTVYRTSTLPDGADTKITITSARNEYESAQVVLRSNTALTISGVTFSDLSAGRGGGMIKSDQLRYRFVAYEDTSTVQPNPFFPDRVGNQLYPKSAVPDPISNETSVRVQANETQPILITSHVPTGTRPGAYHGKAMINTSLGQRIVPIRVDVGSATVPELEDASFVNYHWAMTNGFTWDGLKWQGEGSEPYDVGKYYYGVETYSDDWFALMDEFAARMAEYRTNMTWVRTDLLLQATGTDLSEFTSGIPDDLDWSLFDRYVQTFKDRGFTSFANQHLIHLLNKMPANEKPTADWNTKLPDELPVTDRFLRNYLTALSEHLAAKGWTEAGGVTWYQHILDEPITDDSRNWWTYVAREIKQLNADNGGELRIMDADPESTLLDDRSKPYVDTWAPMTPTFEEHKADYQAEQAAGRDLWVYTCEVNTPPWLNRFWTQPTLTGRLLYWNLQRQGVQGHLHWAWNAWYVGPWSGDSYIVYPDRERRTFKSTVRLEAQRDGIEDYELLAQLTKTRPELARQLVDVALSPDDPRRYTLDPSYLSTLHDYLVRAVSGEEVGPIPEPTSPYLDQEVPRTILVDDGDGIEYSGSWGTEQRQYAYLGEVRTTTAAQAAATHTFEGTGADVVVEKSPTAGRIGVSVDGGAPQLVELYEAIRQDHVTVFRVRDLPAGKHTVRIVNLDGKALRLDAIRVQFAPGQEPSDPTLSTLDVTGVPKIDFDGRIGDYRVLVPADTKIISVTPTLADPGGSLTVNGRPAASGATVSATVPTGKSDLVITSTASDGKTTKTYRIRLLKGAVNTPEVNLARGFSAITASAARSGEGGVTYGPQRAVDGDYGSMFAADQAYLQANPLPHEIALSWDAPQTLNTIVLATRGGLAQGLTDVDVQVGAADGSWTTVAERVPFRWRRDDDDGVMEYASGDLPELTGVRKLRLKINSANWERWTMYAVYELELYQLDEQGELPVE